MKYNQKNEDENDIYWSNQKKQHALSGLVSSLQPTKDKQYFGHLMQRVDSLEKTLVLGGIGGKRRRGRPRMRWLDGITDSMDMSWVNSESW